MERFNIADVARLHGLQIIAHAGVNTYCVCPFCGTKKKQFAYVIKKGNKENMYNCFNCGEKGSAIDLHIKLSPKGKYDNEDNPFKAAVRDIYKAIKNDEAFEEFHRSEEMVAEAADKEIERASDEHISSVYYKMLSLLTLKEDHKKDLLRRGLTEDEIARFRFRSTPSNPGMIVNQLIAKGYDLKGVPGFYTKNGKWQLSITASGYLCPVFDGERNLIIGFQIRVDKPINKCKYIWVSSSGKENGASSGALSTLLPGANEKVIIITEGILKATIVYSLLKGAVTVIGIPGVKCLTSLDYYLERYPKSIVFEAYDMDKAIVNGTEKEMQKTEQIAKDGANLRERINTIGIIVHPLYWDSDKDNHWKRTEDDKYKGLDDFLLFYDNKELFSSYLIKKAENELSLKECLSS